jgi:uncharacterized protein YndB with AHSA1/START domain
MQSYSINTIIQADRHTVYTALTTKKGLSAWWTPDCEVDSTIGGKNIFRFGEMYVVMQIEKIVRDREVVWRCIDQFFKFENVKRTNEWLGTVVEFKLADNEYHETIVYFVHEGLTSKLPSYDASTTLWSYLINICLKGYIEKNQNTSKNTPEENSL